MRPHVSGTPEQKELDVPSEDSWWAPILARGSGSCCFGPLNVTYFNSLSVIYFSMNHFSHRASEVKASIAYWTYQTVTALKASSCFFQVSNKSGTCLSGVPAPGIPLGGLWLFSWGSSVSTDEGPPWASIPESKHAPHWICLALTLYLVDAHLCVSDWKMLLFCMCEESL